MFILFQSIVQKVIEQMHSKLIKPQAERLLAYLRLYALQRQKNYDFQKLLRKKYNQIQRKARIVDKYVQKLTKQTNIQIQPDQSTYIMHKKLYQSISHKEIQNIMNRGLQSQSLYINQEIINVDISVPFLLVRMSEIYVQELQQFICCLANNKQRQGVILITKDHENQIIKQGFINVKDNVQKIQRMTNDALKKILLNSNIRINIQVLPLYNQYQQVKQSIIKLTVTAKDNINFYYVQHKIGNFKPNYCFSVLTKQENGGFKKQKIEGQEIYIQLQRFFKQQIKKVKNNIFSHKCVQNAQQVAVDYKNCYNYEQNIKKDKYFLNIQQNQIFSTICKIVNQENSEYDFPEISTKQLAFVVQINERCNVQQVIQKIKQIFLHSKTKFSYYLPMPQIQTTIANYIKSKNPNITTYRSYYFIYEGTKQSLNLSLKIKLLNSNYNNAITIQNLNHNIYIGMLMTNNQLLFLNTLLFNKFTCLPQIKKNKIIRQNSKQDLYKGVELKFGKEDLNVAIYAYFVLNLTKKRPY